MKLCNQKKKKTAESDDPLSGQMLVSIGRMEFDPEKMRGVLDKSFPSVKLPFHRDCTAQDMLKKCRENIWIGAEDAGTPWLMDLALLLVRLLFVSTFLVVKRNLYTGL